MLIEGNAADTLEIVLATFTIETDNVTWLLDTGATKHVTGNKIF